MSDKRRDRANQLVVVEVSVDFTKHTLLSSAHEHEQIDSANDKIVITDNCVSAVICPIKVAIVPISRLSSRLLSISQSTHCCYQHTNTDRETAQTLSLVLQGRHRTIGVALNSTTDAAIEILCLASRRLPTTETSQRLVQRSSVCRVHHLSRNSDKPAAGGNLHRKETQHRCLAV